MPREPMSDIVPRSRRSIRDIAPSGGRPRIERPSPEVLPEEDTDEAPPPPPARMRGAGFFSRFGLWIIAFVVLVILVFAFSLLFAGSTVKVLPVQKDVTIDGSFFALREPDTQSLGFEIMSIETEVEATVKATGREEVSEHASGRITIFNEFSESSQRLITNTRFETPEGLIYRIREPVVVPGKKEDGTPGSIEVTVFADEPGERYNSGLTDFTIPGFKGTPQFDGFFARSKTPMTGGFEGTRVTLGESDQETVERNLEKKAEEELRAKVQTQKPDGFLLFEQAIFTEHASVIIEETGEDEATAKLRSTLYGILFERVDFGKFVARNTVAGFEESEVVVEDPTALVMTIPDKEAIRPWESDTFSFELEGNAHLVWQFDSVALKRDLAGRPKEALPTVLSGYPSIEEAEVSLRPFWKQSFPEAPERISVKIEN